MIEDIEPEARSMSASRHPYMLGLGASGGHAMSSLPVVNLSNTFAVDNRNSKTRVSLQGASGGRYQTAYFAPSRHWRASFRKCGPFGYLGITSLDGKTLASDQLENPWSHIKTPSHDTIYFPMNGQASTIVGPHLPPQGQQRFTYMVSTESLDFGAHDDVEVVIDEGTLRVLRNGTGSYTTSDIAGKTVSQGVLFPSICFHPDAPTGASVVIEGTPMEARPVTELLVDMCGTEKVFREESSQRFYFPQRQRGSQVLHGAAAAAAGCQKQVSRLDCRATCRHDQRGPRLLP